jgi:hypothetical protein
MKRSQNYLTRTLKHAHALQARYDALGAPRTQKVRNPLPMQALVQTVLPKSKTIQANPVTLTPFARQMLGPKVVAAIERFNAKVSGSTSRLSGMTVNQVVEELEAKGYIVNRQHVAQSLSNAKHDPFSAVGSVQAPYNGQGRRFLYFLRS